MAQVAVKDQRTFFGHPAGLFILFFTEMWERFSYYGMRALLVLYMVNYLFTKPDVANTVFGFAAIKNALETSFGPLGAQPLASQIYGLYTGFVYFTPFFGGILADRLIGQRRSVVIGGILMAIGHFLMASEALFFPALMFLILGNGCFKPNISTQVGNLYEEGDPRRDSAFLIFYMGVNLGAFLSPLICGTLGQRIGWHWGFGAAGVGMVLGLVIYLTGQKYLAPDRLAKIEQGTMKDEPLTPKDWKAIGGLAVLFLVVILFWAVYEQQGNTTQLWADKNTDWNFFGFEIPSSWFQSFNPAMIFIFTPFLLKYWAKLAGKGKEPSSVTKMAIGLFLLGISWLTMIFAARMIGENGKGSVMWLVGLTSVYTLGELYLSPIGLSLVTKVCPPKIVSMMMGAWFLAVFFGNYLSGYIGMFYERMPKVNFFGLLLVLACGGGIIIFLMQKPLKNAIGHNV